MTGEIDPVSLRLGDLSRAVETLTAQWALQDEKASRGREKLYSAMERLRTDSEERRDELTKRVDNLAAKVSALEDKVSGMAPIVRSADREQLQAAGVRKLMRFLGYLIIALIGAFGREIAGWLHIKP